MTYHESSKKLQIISPFFSPTSNTKSAILFRSNRILIDFFLWSFHLYSFAGM